MDGRSWTSNFDNLFSWFRIREKIPRYLRTILGIIPIVLIFFLWIFVTSGEIEERIFSPLILPSPYEVIKSFHSLWFDAELTRSVIASFLRVIGGFIIGAGIAFPIGLFMGSFTKVKALFEPIMVFGAYLPIPALVPLTMSLFGVDEIQKIMFLALAFLVYLLPLFKQSIDDVDNVYLQTGYTMGINRMQAIFKILLPIALPEIINAMRLGFGIGWSYIILAEMVASERGLGHIIIVAQRRGPREHIYLVLAVIVVLAYITDKLWMLIGKKLFPYTEAQ